MLRTAIASTAALASAASGQLLPEFLVDDMTAGSLFAEVDTSIDLVILGGVASFDLDNIDVPPTLTIGSGTSVATFDGSSLAYQALDVTLDPLQVSIDDTDTFSVPFLGGATLDVQLDATFNDLRVTLLEPTGTAAVNPDGSAVLPGVTLLISGTADITGQFSAIGTGLFSDLNLVVPITVQDAVFDTTQQLAGLPVSTSVVAGTLVVDGALAIDEAALNEALLMALGIDFPIEGAEVEALLALFGDAVPPEALAFLENVDITIALNNLLIEAAFSSTFDTAAGVTFAGCNAADRDENGTISFGDVTAFIDAFNTGDILPIAVDGTPSADANGDLSISFADATAFIEAFNAGCP